MFDDLRAQAGEIAYEEEESDLYSFKEKKEPPKGPFLGMTPPQRFVIAVMLLMMTCILSTFCLLVTERVWIPFLG